MTTTTKTRPVRYRIIATNYEGQEALVATAPTLPQLLRAMDREFDFWAARGYGSAELEDNTLGRSHWTPVLWEHLRGMRKRGEIDYATWKAFRPYVA